MGNCYSLKSSHKHTITVASPEKNDLKSKTISITETKENNNYVMKQKSHHSYHQKDHIKVKKTAANECKNKEENNNNEDKNNESNPAPASNVKHNLSKPILGKLIQNQRK